MKNCKDIENNLPLYAEDLLSADEKRAVQEHLAECANCSKALADLQKVAGMAQGLSEVEPPPWFKQKIMARVWQEAEKKSFAQKWFYPLRIKIPVQVMATVVIAVLTVYIYRSGDEQMKTVLPDAAKPSLEMQKEQAPGEMTKARKAEPSPLAAEKTEAIGAASKDKKSDEVSSGGSAPKMEMLENKLADTSDKSPAIKGDIRAEKEEKKSTEFQALQEAPQRYAAKQESIKDLSAVDSSLSGVAKKSKMFQAAAPASIASSSALQPQANIFVHVSDVNKAAVEAEKILTKNEARKISKQLIDNKAILQAEIPAQNLENLLSRLRAIGRVSESNMRAERGGQDIKVVIEIIK